MLSNFLKILYFIIIIIFFYFTISTYFSENNISKIRNKILLIDREVDLNSYDLPVVKNDTNNIIIYNTGEVIKKKIKKRKIWELLN
tara:strand:+ start:3273 stop:3530 length:258 start_codon:yes stop_codon:yes gene_type:complete